MTIQGSPTFNDAQSTDEGAGAAAGSFCGAFNAANLKALTDRTGYTLLQQNGQRKYGGPPPNWQGPPPNKCEVFVGKIPRDLYEDDLVPVLEKAGKIYELRLMMDFSNHNRGYAFCTYQHKDEALAAVRILNNYEIRPGRMIGVCMSIDNCRLFVGGIPKNRTREETMHEMSQITEGVVDCIMYPSAADKTKNRGFAFIEYESHRAAAMARRKLIPGKILLWGQQIAVDWAEPEAQVDDEVMKSVRILYLRGLQLTTKEEKLEEMITKMFDHKALERVKKIRDFAFVHFYNREDAEVAFEQLNGANIEGVEIEVTWAKPPDKDQIRYTKGNHKPVPPLPIPPNFFESGGTPFDASFRQPMQMPFVGSPPGSLTAASNQVFGYPSGGSSSTGSIPSGGRLIGKGSAGMKGAGVKSQYNRMLQQQQQQQQMAAVAAVMRNGAISGNPMMGAAPGMPPAANTNPMMGSALQQPSFLATPFKRPNDILEDICVKIGWTAPVYTYMKNPSTTGYPQFSCQVQIFLNKGEGEQPMSMKFQSPRPCATLEEAKTLAAETTLQTMLYTHKDQLTMSFASPIGQAAAQAAQVAAAQAAQQQYMNPAADAQRRMMDNGMGAAAMAVQQNQAAQQQQANYIQMLSAAAALGGQFPGAPPSAAPAGMFGPGS